MLPCREIQSHVPEPFWYIHVTYRPEPQQHQQQQSQQPQQRQPQPGCEFTWVRGRLFDQDVAAMLYEACAEEPVATVMQVCTAVKACLLLQQSDVSDGWSTSVAHVTVDSRS